MPVVVELMLCHFTGLTGHGDIVGGVDAPPSFTGSGGALLEVSPSCAIAFADPSAGCCFAP